MHLSHPHITRQTFNPEQDSHCITYHSTSVNIGQHVRCSMVVHLLCNVA